MMKSLFQTATLVAAICFSAVFATPNSAVANSQTYEQQQIEREIDNLESLLMRSLIAGDYRSADILNEEIRDLEILLQLISETNGAVSGKNNGRVSNVSTLDLGSSRILRMPTMTFGFRR